jgi:hypothetical protein
MILNPGFEEFWRPNFPPGNLSPHCYGPQFGWINKPDSARWVQLDLWRSGRVERYCSTSDLIKEELNCFDRRWFAMQIFITIVFDEVKVSVYSCDPSIGVHWLTTHYESSRLLISFCFHTTWETTFVRSRLLRHLKHMEMPDSLDPDVLQSPSITMDPSNSRFPTQALNPEALRLIKKRGSTMPW